MLTRHEPGEMGCDMQSMADHTCTRRHATIATFARELCVTAAATTPAGSHLNEMNCLATCGYIERGTQRPERRMLATYAWPFPNTRCTGNRERDDDREQPCNNASLSSKAVKHYVIKQYSLH